jgi:hypothetical protein
MEPRAFNAAAQCLAVPTPSARPRRSRRPATCLLPGVVKTYGVKGHTPVVDEWQTHDHLSIMAGLTTDGRVYTLVRQKFRSSSSP